MKPLKRSSGHRPVRYIAWAAFGLVYFVVPLAACAYVALMPPLGLGKPSLSLACAGGYGLFVRATLRMWLVWLLRSAKSRAK